MRVLDVLTSRNRGPVLTMRLEGREPVPGDAMRRVGSDESWRVLGVERNRRGGPLHQGEPIGLLVANDCPIAVGDDVEVVESVTVDVPTANLICGRYDVCERAPSEPRPCPYKSEINDDETPCTCCAQCRADCCDEI